MGVRASTRWPTRDDELRVGRVGVAEAPIVGKHADGLVDQTGAQRAWRVCAQLRAGCARK